MKRLVILAIAVLCIFIVTSPAIAQYGWWPSNQQQGYQPNPYLQQQQEMNRQLDQLNQQMRAQRQYQDSLRMRQQADDLQNRFNFNPGVQPYRNTQPDSGSRGNTYFGW